MLDVYLDADACPVKEDTFRVAKRYGLRVYVVSNSPIFLPRAEWIVPVVVGGGFDAADDRIVEVAGTDDIVVTADLLLAARCIEKKCRVIDHRGRVIDENNVGEVLAMRELMSELRQRGEMGLGPARMGKKQHSSYSAQLDLLINRIKKENR